MSFNQRFFDIHRLSGGPVSDGKNSPAILGGLDFYSSVEGGSFLFFWEGPQAFADWQGPYSNKSDARHWGKILESQPIKLANRWK